MSYHMCTGMEVPSVYNSILTEKCDSNNKTFDEFVSMFYFITYLFFGSMVIYENSKRRRHDRTNHNVQSRFHIIFNNKLFFLRLTFCVVTYQV